MSATLDDLDRQLIRALRLQPRASVTELSRDLGVARGTIYARLDRFEADGVVGGYGPEVKPAAIGFDVLAFSTIEIAQGSHDGTITALQSIPAILEAHTITGAGDLLVRVVARSNEHLHEVLQTISSIPTVERIQTQLALHSSLSRTIADVIDFADFADTSS